MARLRFLTKILCCAVIWTVAWIPAFAGTEIEAITLAVEPGKLYVPVDEAVHELQWEVGRNLKGKCTLLNTCELRPGKLRCLPSGTELVSSEDLVSAGASVTPDPGGRKVDVTSGGCAFTLVINAKRAAVSLARQQLSIWQGTRLVMQSRVSSGRNGRTPAGHFQAGPDKARMHRSKLYHYAPMPWAVQIDGHVFIHGFTSVPRRPASHGCIRVPLNEGNPAKFFYEWVDLGVPVDVTEE